MNEPAIQLSESILPDVASASLISHTARGKTRCQAMNNAGEQCAMPVMNGSDAFCYQHNPENKKAISDDGRKAALIKHQKLRAVIKNSDDLVPSSIETPDDLLKVLRLIIVSSMNGKLDSKLTTSTTYAVNAAFRGLELNKPKMNEKKLRLKLRTTNPDGSQKEMEMEIEGPADVVNEVAAKGEKETT